MMKMLENFESKVQQYQKKEEYLMRISKDNNEKV